MALTLTHMLLNQVSSFKIKIFINNSDNFLGPKKYAWIASAHSLYLAGTSVAVIFELVSIDSNI
jgi:hypothetical protein